MLLVVPPIVLRKSQATAPWPSLLGPSGAPTGALELSFFFDTANPNWFWGVWSRLKTGVVVSEKKCLPEISKLAGARGELGSVGSGYWIVRFGSSVRMSGYRAATQETL